MKTWQSVLQAERIKAANCNYPTSAAAEALAKRVVLLESAISIACRRGLDIGYARLMELAAVSAEVENERNV